MLLTLGGIVFVDFEHLEPSGIVYSALCLAPDAFFLLSVTSRHGTWNSSPAATHKPSEELKHLRSLFTFQHQTPIVFRPGQTRRNLRRHWSPIFSFWTIFLSSAGRCWPFGGVVNLVDFYCLLLSTTVGCSHLSVDIYVVTFARCCPDRCYQKKSPSLDCYSLTACPGRITKKNLGPV